MRHARILAVFTLLLGIEGCAPEPDGGVPVAGTGGKTGGSGGASGSGGSSVGTGGRSGSGGATGSGGTSAATGGSGSGSGGSGSGGSSSGGATATGGSQGTGATAGRGSGGNTLATGGSGSGTGGSGAGTGGGVGSGGATGTGGAGSTAMSAGCGINTTPPSATVQQTIQAGGKTRYYLLHVPAGYSSSKAMPLLFVHHGLGGTNTWASLPPKSSDWFGRFALKEATNGAAIIAYPMGSTTNAGSPGNSEALPSALGQSSWGSGDLPFFDALFTDIKAKYCINTKRVFAAGYSMGGMFSNMLACERASSIRGISNVSGWGPNGSPGGSDVSCGTASKALAAMGIHGSKDGTVGVASGRASAAFWAQSNGCGTQLGTSTYSNCKSYQGCPAGKEVHFCEWSGDHQVPTWAGSNMWKFFSSLPDL